MANRLARKLAQIIGEGRYPFVVAGVVFVSLLMAAGLRAAPGVLMIPLISAFGWSVRTLSLSAALGIFLYGMVGPFAAALMQRFGIRTVLLASLLLMSLSVGVCTWMTQPWHLILAWGVLSGLGSGGVSTVLGMAIVNRWFVRRRGLVMGLLTASGATGTLIFMPGFAALVQARGWQPVVWVIAGSAAALVPLVAFLIPEHPSDAGLTAFGADPRQHPAPPSREDPFRAAMRGLGDAARHRDFWFLFGTFFICGFTTNGLVGTHLISFCSDRGLPEIQGAELLAVMGIFDLVGTTLSGWLTDRFDARRLLFIYYGVRGLSLVYLAHCNFSKTELAVFSVFYGLDWVATVPPTVRLATDVFGEKAAPIVFGWVVAGHQMGAASAAYLAGFLRSVQGSYLQSFMISGLVGVAAAFMSLAIARVKPRQGWPRAQTT